MIKLRILVDMDGIVADFVTAFLAEYKEFDPSAQLIGIGDIHTWHSELSLPNPALGKSVMNRICTTERFWATLPVMAQNAESIMNDWMERGHDVYFATSPWRSHASLSGKHLWLEEHFPNFVERVYYTNHKTGIPADLLIDDKPKTLHEYKKRWSDAKVATIRYAYHATEKPPVGTLMADDCERPFQAWIGLDKHVKHLEDNGRG